MVNSLLFPPILVKKSRLQNGVCWPQGSCQLGKQPASLGESPVYSFPGSHAPHIFIYDRFREDKLVNRTKAEGRGPQQGCRSLASRICRDVCGLKRMLGAGVNLSSSLGSPMLPQYPDSSEIRFPHGWNPTSQLEKVALISQMRRPATVPSLLHVRFPETAANKPSRSIPTPQTLPRSDNPTQSHPQGRNPLYMQWQQGLGHVLLKPGTIEGQVANLLALGIEQEGAHRRRGHVGPGCGPHHGRSHGGYTCGEEEGGRRTRAKEMVSGEKKSYFPICQSLQKHQKFFTPDRCAPDGP